MLDANHVVTEERATTLASGEARSAGMRRAVRAKCPK